MSEETDPNEILIGGPSIRFLELESLCMEEIITIIPNFTLQENLSLIRGDFGPFEAALPIRVPLWIAIALKKLKKCSINPPTWMDTIYLSSVLAQEQEIKTNITKLPSKFFIEMASILLHYASDDMTRRNLQDVRQIRSLIEDIIDVRASKVRVFLQSNMTAEGVHLVKFTDLTRMEIMRIRPYTTQVLNNLSRLSSTFSEQQLQQRSSNINDLYGSSLDRMASSMVGGNNVRRNNQEPAVTSGAAAPPRARDLRRFQT